jgi:hypothetical protein
MGHCVPHRAIRGFATAPAASRLLPHPSYPLRGHMRAGYTTRSPLYGVLLHRVSARKSEIKHSVSILPLPSTMSPASGAKQYRNNEQEPHILRAVPILLL